MYGIMKDSTKIVVMKVKLWSKACVSGKIATLVFGASVEIAPQWKQKKCICCQDVEAVRDFNLQGIYVLSQAIILSEFNDRYFYLPS